jgi:hypothetical protein
MKKSAAMAGLVPMLVAGGALFWLAVRPCEPIAQANSQAPVASVWFDGVTVTPNPPEVDVESLPKAPKPQAKPMAHPAPKSGCHWMTPFYKTNGWRPLDTTEGGQVQFWYCGK